MTTAEPAPASLGPRYAPEDSTLPKPWMGLIDGSTGLLYYWNPETNVTQYEKPAPPVPPPSTTTPKLAQIPMVHSVQPNGMMVQTTVQQGQQTNQLPQQAPSQQITQSTQQQGQHSSQLALQHGQLMAQQSVLPVAQVSNQQVAQQQGPQPGQGAQQPGHLRPQMMQHPGQQMLSSIGQQVSQQGVQQSMQQQTMQQTPHQVGQNMLQHQNLQMSQPQGQQYAYQHFMTYPQSMPSHNQQGSTQQFPNQHDYKAAFSKMGETDFQQGNQSSFSPSHFQQAAVSQNMPAGGDSVSTPQAGQPQQFSGFAVNMQQPASMTQLQPIGADLVNQKHGQRFQNQVGPSMMHNQQSNVPPVGLTTGCEQNIHGRTGNDYCFNPKIEGPIVSPGQPNLAAMPMGINQQVYMCPCSFYHFIVCVSMSIGTDLVENIYL